jgi:hypothetical protein
MICFDLPPSPAAGYEFRRNYQRQTRTPSTNAQFATGATTASRTTTGRRAATASLVQRSPLRNARVRRRRLCVVRRKGHCIRQNSQYKSNTSIAFFDLIVPFGLMPRPGSSLIRRDVGRRGLAPGICASGQFRARLNSVGALTPRHSGHRSVYLVFFNSLSRTDEHALCNFGLFTRKFSSTCPKTVIGKSLLTRLGRRPCPC